VRKCQINGGLKEAKIVTFINMTEFEELAFKLSSNGDMILITMKSITNDGWIESDVEIKAGGFTGSYNAAFMVYDFSLFRDQLKLIYDDLNGIAKFISLEGQLQINIKGDGLGHLMADCIAMEKVGYGNELRFQIDFDQTYIPMLLKQLDSIIEQLS
jgi:hypothetical protein